MHPNPHDDAPPCILTETLPRTPPFQLQDQDYCLRTKRRQEVTCEKEDELDPSPNASFKRLTVTTYEPCSQTSADDLTAVIRFQVGGGGGEKRKAGSLRTISCDGCSEA